MGAFIYIPKPLTFKKASGSVFVHIESVVNPETTIKWNMGTLYILFCIILIMYYYINNCLIHIDSFNKNNVKYSCLKCITMEIWYNVCILTDCLAFDKMQWINVILALTVMSLLEWHRDSDTSLRTCFISLEQRCGVTGIQITAYICEGQTCD